MHLYEPLGGDSTTHNNLKTTVPSPSDADDQVVLRPKAAPSKPPRTYASLDLDTASRIEQEIDQLNINLEPLRSFVLPGGTPASSYLHLARTVIRRAERLMVQLSLTENNSVSEIALKYVNRLSDLCFVAARYANQTYQGGQGDTLWRPGETNNNE